MSVLESIAQDHVGVSCWRSAADKSYALMMQADLLERKIVPPQTKVSAELVLAPNEVPI